MTALATEHQELEAKGWAISAQRRVGMELKTRKELVSNFWYILDSYLLCHARVYHTDSSTSV